MKPKTAAQTVEVRADGEGLVSHAGAYLLSELAGRIGLTEALSVAMSPTRERRSAHDPGRLLRDLAVGFHPLLCYLSETGEPLAGLLRPGNAGSNTAADHFEVLQSALEQLPEADLGKDILVRADSGGKSKAFAADCRDAGIRFSLGYELRDRAREAIVSLPQSAWREAIDAEGEAREGAQVAELSEQIDLSAWPQGTRLIVRRERPHPGAQFQVFDSHGYRHTAFITDQQGTDIATLELRHRRRARVEDAIRCAKETGMRGLPFAAFEHNRVWLELSLIAQDLLCWAARLCLRGSSPTPSPSASASASCTSPGGSCALGGAPSCACPAPGRGPAPSPRRSRGCDRCRRGQGHSSAPALSDQLTPMPHGGLALRPNTSRSRSESRPRRAERPRSGFVEPPRGSTYLEPANRTRRGENGESGLRRVSDQQGSNGNRPRTRAVSISSQNACLTITIRYPYTAASS